MQVSKAKRRGLQDYKSQARGCQHTMQNLLTIKRNANHTYNTLLHFRIYTISWWLVENFPTPSVAYPSHISNSSTVGNNMRSRGNLMGNQ